MIVIVDKNEATTNPKVFAQIKASFSNVVLANLPHHEYGGITVTAGDINIPLDDGNLLAIERKTPEDFLNSVADRHVFNQVEIMASHAKYSAIIVTGSFTYGKRDDMCYIIGQDGEERTSTNWRGKRVRSAIRQIQYSGCPIEFCPPTRFCTTVGEVYETANKPDERQEIIKRRIVTFPPVDERVQFLAQLPGIGMKLAESLLQFAGMMDGNADEDGYGSIASALHWVTILSQVSKTDRPAGWGPNKILTVRKFFGLGSNEYIAQVKEVTLQDVEIKVGKLVNRKGTSTLVTEMNGKYYGKVKEASNE